MLWVCPGLRHVAAQAITVRNLVNMSAVAVEHAMR
jgi:hypothetical protein